MVTKALLRTLRNDLPMPYVFGQLGDQAPFAKSVEGRFRFVCPHCGELLATLNPRNNLAHCFNCAANINNIDLLIALGYPFRQAVEQLHRWLLLYRNQASSTAAPQSPTRSSNQGPQSLAEILRREFGNGGADG